ncbi:DUF4129 domain-containing protein [Arthrobacter echini]|uniref:DUF4129 domain-containing protein n=1 Tax=Arthrobacter echini TaxID=1529066 RepID=A0A5D0XSV9_9MICC|nr:DUF4129 domain-containing protein [Arthrobacter echini]TYC99659.1 DUF4129 domain-containing protein [Arthrobacter echini]
MLVLAVLAAGSMGELSARPVVDAGAGAVEPTSVPTPSAEAGPEPLVDDGDRLRIDPSVAVAVALLLVIGLLALLVRFLLRLRARPPIRGGSLDSARVRPPGILEPLAESLPAWTRAAEDELTGSTDTSDAVIRCWLAFEQLCAGAGIPRGSTQTTSDFAAAAAQSLDLPMDAVTALNRLYQRARFARDRRDDREALGPGDRALALRSVRLLAASVQDGERP